MSAMEAMLTPMQIDAQTSDGGIVNADVGFGLAESLAGLTRSALVSGTAAGEASEREWLPDMDLNHDKQIQSLLCYRYTIGQDGVVGN